MVETSMRLLRRLVFVLRPLGREGMTAKRQSQAISDNRDFAFFLRAKFVKPNDFFDEMACTADIPALTEKWLQTVFQHSSMCFLYSCFDLQIFRVQSDCVVIREPRSQTLCPSNVY